MSSRAFGLVALASACALFALAAMGCAPNEQIEGSVQDAQSAYDTGEFADAAKELKTIVEQDADDLDARRLYALVLAAQGENEQAIEQYSQVIEAEPEDDETLYRAALLERLIGNTEDAITHLEKAVEVGQDDSYSDELARTYMQVGKFKEAAATWGSLLEDAGRELESKVELLKLQADAYQSAKDYDSARGALEDAIELAPNDGDLKIKLEALSQ